MGHYRGGLIVHLRYYKCKLTPLQPVAVANDHVAYEGKVHFCPLSLRGASQNEGASLPSFLLGCGVGFHSTKPSHLPPHHDYG